MPMRPYQGKTAQDPELPMLLFNWPEETEPLIVVLKRGGEEQTVLSSLRLATLFDHACVAVGQMTGADVGYSGHRTLLAQLWLTDYDPINQRIEVDWREDGSPPPPAKA